MKKIYLASAAALALSAGGAFADAHADLMVPVGEGDFTWDSYVAWAEATDLTGETIEITGPWTGEEAEKVNAVLAYLAAATGATVNYSGSDSFEQDIVISTRAGSPPDIAIFPQPGLAADLAAQGLLTPLAEGTREFVEENYAAGSSWVDLGTYADPDGEDQLYGMFYRVDLKSLVWYSPEAFEEAGYDVPQTMEQLIALSDQMVADGTTPWCIGIGSEAATGWPATDWVEDIMLRTQDPSVYDAWVANEIPFDDPRIVSAIETFGSFALNEDYVNGGVEAVASTDFRESPLGLFTFPAECYMHRQASFIPAFFPEGTVVGEDVDFFYFPAFEAEDLGRPVLGAGTLATITDDTPGAAAFIEFLSLPIAHELWMAQGGFLTAHGGVNLATYASDSERAQGEILAEATTFRFDASDLMPGEIGAGAFWTGMVDYVTGDDAASVAAGIQARWAEIQ